MKHWEIISTYVESMTLDLLFDIQNMNKAPLNLFDISQVCGEHYNVSNDV